MARAIGSQSIGHRFESGILHKVKGINPAVYAFFCVRPFPGNGTDVRRGAARSVVCSFSGRENGMLAEGLARIGFSDAEREHLIPVLEQYVSELELFNAVRDIVGAGTRGDIVIRHIFDSLSPYVLLRSFMETLSPADGGKRLCAADVGSGGGLPGIPLAAAFPGTDFVLIERMSRRCAFLENCAAVLSLANVSVENTEAERAQPGRFDIVVFRAFRPLDAKMTPVLLRMLKPHGILAAYKGKRSRIDGEMDALRGLVPRWKAYKVDVPYMETEERHVVVIPAAQTE